MSLIDVIFKKNALPKVPASLKELVGEIRGIKTAIADLWRSMTNAEGNINRLDEAVEADENTLGDITKHKVYLTGSTLSQSMMPLNTGQNTIYVVVDNLTLTENVTIPMNCVLAFEGGSLSGYKLASAGNTIIEGYGNKCVIDDATAKNFKFNQPLYVDPTIASESDADGSFAKPYKSLQTAHARTNWIALKANTIYTPGCTEGFDTPLTMSHNTLLECIEGVATISGYVTIQGSASVSSNVVTLTIASITDELGNVLPYSESKKEMFNFGYVEDGYSANFRGRVKTVDSVGNNQWSNATDGGTSYSLPVIKIGEQNWNTKRASVGCHGIVVNANTLTIKNIIIRDFGKHGIFAGNGNIMAFNCQIKNIGGSYQDIANKILFGNGVEVYTTNAAKKTLVVYDCEFMNIFDAGATIQGPGNSLNNFDIRGCVFNGCSYGIEYFLNTSADQQSPINYNARGTIMFNKFFSCCQRGTRWNIKPFADQEMMNQAAIQLWNNQESLLKVEGNEFVDSPVYGTKSGNVIPQTRYNSMIYRKPDAIVVTPFYWPYGVIVQMEGVNAAKASNDFWLISRYNNSNNVFSVDLEANHSGDTASRPTTNICVGFEYFDTSLSPARPIWYKGNNVWVDATGTQV